MKTGKARKIRRKQKANSLDSVLRRAWSSDVFRLSYKKSRIFSRLSPSKHTKRKIKRGHLKKFGQILMAVRGHEEGQSDGV